MRFGSAGCLGSVPPTLRGQHASAPPPFWDQLRGGKRRWHGGLEDGRQQEAGLRPAHVTGCETFSCSSVCLGVRLWPLGHAPALEGVAPARAPAQRGAWQVPVLPQGHPKLVTPGARPQPPWPGPSSLAALEELCCSCLLAGGLAFSLFLFPLEGMERLRVCSGQNRTAAPWASSWSHGRPAPWAANSPLPVAPGPRGASSLLCPLSWLGRAPDGANQMLQLVPRRGGGTDGGPPPSAGNLFP